MAEPFTRADLDRVDSHSEGRDYDAAVLLRQAVPVTVFLVGVGLQLTGYTQPTLGWALIGVAVGWAVIAFLWPRLRRYWPLKWVGFVRSKPVADGASPSATAGERQRWESRTEIFNEANDIMLELASRVGAQITRGFAC